MDFHLPLVAWTFRYPHRAYSTFDVMSRVEDDRHDEEQAPGELPSPKLKLS